MGYPEWHVWGNDGIGRDYGNVLFNRAVGDLPEMQCSIEAAKRLEPVIRGSDTVADVGCGAGHYLRSLRRRVMAPFQYIGVDGTREYVDLAQKAFEADKRSSFQYGDIFNIPLADNSADVTLCCNVLLHLPSIEKPIAELLRITKRHLLIRTLVGRSTFIIKEARSDKYSETGEPLDFNYFNIYSAARIESAVKACGATVTIEPDTSFEGDRINDDVAAHGIELNLTRVIGNTQVRDYIIQPWAWLTITPA